MTFLRFYIDSKIDIFCLFCSIFRLFCDIKYFFFGLRIWHFFPKLIDNKQWILCFKKIHLPCPSFPMENFAGPTNIQTGTSWRSKSEYWSTVWPEKNAANFQIRIFEFFCGKYFWNFACKYLWHSTLYIWSQKTRHEMATLTYRHFGNPGQRGTCAPYSKQTWLVISWFSCLPPLQTVSPSKLWVNQSALQCHSRRPRRAAAGGRGHFAAGFLTIYI